MYTPLENAPQGSAAWHAARAKHFCASEAAAALGLSKYTTRDELLRQKATGITEEVGAAKQRIFDAGHDAEALARPIAVGIAGTELFPVVGTREVDGMALLASFDGIDILDELIWENKLLNQSLLQQVQAGDLEPHYWLQLEHQLLVSGASRALFTTSDGTPDGTHPLWYESKPDRRAQLIAGWKQFAVDLAAWVPPEAKPAPVVGKTPDNLPALLIQVTGAVTASNLPEYKAHALEVFRGINRTLTTDQDFATAESTVKWCADVESRLAAAKDHALSQTATIDELFRTLDDISAEARRTRLELDKLVKARKEEIRGEIVAGGVTALREHIASLNARLGKPYMPQVPADFAGAIKGKRTVDSLRGAVNDELARAKIESSAIADRIQINLGTLRELAGAHALLFADTATIVLKQPEDLTMLVKSRIADHQAAEQARLDAERERIRAEEAAKLQREAREAEARAEHDRFKEAMHQELLRAEREAAESAKNQAVALTQQSQAAIKPVAYCCENGEAQGLVGKGCDDCAETSAGYQAAMFAPVVNVVPMRAAPAPADRTGIPTLKLGTINERLGGVVTTNADGLRSLGFAATAVGNSKLYHEADFPEILAALVRHIEGVQAKAAA
jgi:predicted phage-related endonuclease